MDTPPPTQPTRIEIEGFSGRLRRHSTELVRLATPIVISRSGFLFLVMADTVMTGRFDAEELAYLAIGLGLIMPMMITSLGMIMGTLVLTANAFGAGRADEEVRLSRRRRRAGLHEGVLVRARDAAHRTDKL